ncbi:MAG: LysM peptidoglycan-binding domain-containing protein [Planctomycetota bacterium]|nr:LysM peptidoglycan-binding domain-containing protein [Planctomycetota bacterium]
MKFMLPLLGLAVLVAGGCASHKAATDTSAMELSPPSNSMAAAPVSYAPMAQPAPIQTAVPDTAAYPASATMNPLMGSPASGGTYTVKPGDTLWKISASHYGDGKKWKQIADANPGLTPSKLRIGQTITLP